MMRLTPWMTAALIAGVAGAGAVAPAAHAQEVVAVKADRIITLETDSGVIEGGVIVIQGGRIAAVGKAADVAIPWDAKVIDAAGLTLAPGAIDAVSRRGLDRANERVPVVPFVSVADGYDPVHRSVEDALRHGCTTLGLTPGPSTIFGGQCSVVRTAGSTVASAMRRRDWAQLISMGPRSGTSRPGHLAELRKAIADARAARARRADAKEDAAMAGKPAPKASPDPRSDAILRWLDGEQPALLACPSAADLHRAGAFLAAAKAEATLLLGPDAWRAASFLAGRKALVVLDAGLVQWDADPDDPERETRHVTPAALHAAGVRFAVTSDPGSALGRSLWYQAALCVRHEVPRDTALKAITLHAAEVLGLQDRLGSLKVGKDADLVAFTGDPLAATSWVDWVMIEGRVVYERSEDPVIKRLVGEPKKK
jgi:imidazolonepropionase-like amidohydrolase